jgi:hypothetical protein
MGPWYVATKVPESVYAIPPSCPIYPVTQVYVYETYPDSVIVGYLPGYVGCYVGGPTIVYGTGYYYPGWVGATYFAWPCTWGFHAHYDFFASNWSFGLGFAWGAHPGWFGHNHGWNNGGWWGPGGFHGKHRDLADFGPAHHGLQVDHDRPGNAPLHASLYSRPENPARAAEMRHNPLATVHARTSASVPNDVFADRNGRVLQRTDQGWRERESDRWKAIADEPRRTDAPPMMPRPGAEAPREGPLPGGTAPREMPPVNAPPREMPPANAPPPSQRENPPQREGSPRAAEVERPRMNASERENSWAGRARGAQRASPSRGQQRPGGR